VLTANIPGVYANSLYIPYLGPISKLTSPAQAFRNAMAKYAPQASLGEYGIGGYAAASLLMHALQLAGKCPTQADVISKMRAQSAYNSAGLIPKDIQYTPGITPNGNPQNCFYYIQISASGTAFEPVKAPVCG